MSEVEDLSVIIHDEGDHLWAEVEQFPGVFVTGQDVDELQEALEEAISMYLAASPEQRPRVILEFRKESESRRPARMELANT